MCVCVCVCVCVDVFLSFPSHLERYMYILWRYSSTREAEFVSGAWFDKCVCVCACACVCVNTISSTTIPHLSGKLVKFPWQRSSFLVSGVTSTLTPPPSAVVDVYKQ